MAKRRKDNYQVVVGNVGTVYDGPNKKRAESEFNAYKAISLTGKGRAGGGDVTILFTDGQTGNQDVLEEHAGHLQTADN